MRASLEAVNRLKREKDEQRRALYLHLRQMDYEAKRAFGSTARWILVTVW